MKKFFNKPIMEIKCFDMENIVTGSGITEGTLSENGVVPQGAGIITVEYSTILTY